MKTKIKKCVTFFYILLRLSLVGFFVFSFSMFIYELSTPVIKEDDLIETVKIVTSQKDELENIERAELPSEYLLPLCIAYLALQLIVILIRSNWK